MSLLNDGPIIAVGIGPPEGDRAHAQQAKALLDSGAERSLVRRDLAERLQLDDRGAATMLRSLDTEPTTCTMHLVDLHLEMATLRGVQVFAAPWSTSERHFDCIIGRDVLALFEFTYHGEAGTFSLVLGANAAASMKERKQ